MKKTTKLRDRKKALQVANFLEMESANGMSERQARSMIAHLCERMGCGNLREEKVHDYLARWLQRKEGEVSGGTLRKYRETVKHFTDFLGDGGRKTDLSSITSRQVATFRDALARRLSVGTVNIALKIVRSALQDAVRAHLLATNEAAAVKGLSAKHTAKVRRCFTVDELQRVLAVAGAEWRAIILASYYTGGQRLGDVTRWTWANVNLDHNEIRFQTRKTGRSQVIPLVPELRAVLLALPGAHDPAAPIFADAAGKLAKGRRENVSVLSAQFYSLLVRAGLAAPRSHAETGGGRSVRRQSSPLGFHSLRHTATSLMKTAGIGGAIVRDIVGHDSPEISEHYTHIDDGAKRNALASLPTLCAA